jgi:hypothetical protein
MSTYFDLLITGDDLTLDGAQIPVIISDREVIAQDLVHMIREAGYLPPLIGNRNKDLSERTKIEITIAVDNDYRIVPGSAYIEEPAPGTFWLVADTIDFGTVRIYMGTLPANSGEDVLDEYLILFGDFESVFAGLYRLANIGLSTL